MTAAPVLKYYTAKPLFAGTNINVAADCLGEGPVWDHRYERFIWIDIGSQCVSIYDVASSRVSRFGLKNDIIGFAVPTTDRDVLICGSQNGVFLLNLITGRIHRTSHPERHLVRNRFNDGKVDPYGRLFAGTMQMKRYANDAREKGSARLYCIGPGEHTQPQVMESVGRVTVSNGMGWSPEGDFMYYIDTPTNEIQAFNYSRSEGPHNKRVVYEMHEGASPDGMCVDADGFIWVAALKAGEVRRVDPMEGTVVAVVQVPTPLVTSCCFGGEYLSTLFITTARGTTPDAAEKCTDPHAGLVYAIDLGEFGFRGLPMTPFKLSDQVNAAKL